MTYLGRNEFFYNIPGLEPSFTTYPGRNTVLRHVWLEHSFTTCPGRDAVIRHVLVGTLFYDMPWSRYSFLTCPGQEAVL